jgi:hypothetical protein
VSKKSAARVGAPLALILSVAAGWSPHVPTNLPAAALGSAFILRVERGLLVFVVLLFVLVVLVRAIWEGELPTKIGREGAEYVTADPAEKSLETLATLSHRQWRIANASTVLQQQKLDDLTKRIAMLEQKQGGTDEGPSDG